MKVWGLTGGIASGKSQVAQFLKAEGFAVLDADQIARELSAPGGKAQAALLARFGALDREALRAHVFQDPQARKDLEAILHPLIRKETEARIARLSQASPPPAGVVYEAALLVETGRYRELDGLIVVEAPAELRLKRLMARSGLSEGEARMILDAQLSDEERAKVATHRILNAGTLAELEAKTQEISRLIKV